MTEAKFTPGPWRVVIDDDGNPLSGRPSIAASEELDCGIVHWDGFVQEHWRSARGDKEIHANARLIAAAPDMYAALRLAEQFICNGIELGFIRMPDASTPDPARDTPGIIRAALSRASEAE